MKYGHFIGRLGRDWEAKTVGQYRVYENSMAVRAGKDGKDTLWVKLAQWGEKPGEILKKFTSKGSMLAVHGDIEIRAWDKSGTPQAEITCKVTNFEFIGSQSGSSEQSAAPAQTLAKSNEAEDDIPF